MSTITLRGFIDPRVTYYLDPASGTYTSSKARKAEDIDSVRFSGFGSEMKIGVFRPHVGFFAAFVDDGGMRLWLERSLVDCSKYTDCRVKRRFAGPFLRCFVLEEGGHLIFRAMYWSANAESWPTSGDIFSFVVENTHSAEARSRFVEFWSAVREGREVPLTQ